MAKINAQRLSKYIASRECKRATDFLVDIVGSLSHEQRAEIREMLWKNKNTIVK